MNLAHAQACFLAQVLDAGAGWPSRWDARMACGLAVYRNNYRQALMAAMRATFERTLRWVGEAAFDAAAAHHLVSCPPTGWTLDDAGTGFPETVAGLFPRDPDVADLAALEWAMHRAFTAADSTCMDLAAWRHATVGFAGDDWARMRLLPTPGLAVLDVRTDCVALWRSLADDGAGAEPPPLERTTSVIVWREDWRPVCRLATRLEGQALRRIAAGTSYGALCAHLVEDVGVSAEDAAREAGHLLAGWLHAGLLTGVEPAGADGQLRG